MKQDDQSVPDEGIDGINLRFDLIELETFLAVADLGSFSAAAKKMHVSQPSVTNRVQRLEAMLKTKLVERTTRRVTPTPDGEELARRARLALQGLRELLTDFHARAAASKMRTVIATTPMLAAVVLPQLIQSFRQAYPSIQIQVRDLQYEAVLATLEAGQADLAVSAFDGESSKLHFEPLAREPMLVVLPKAHPLAGAQDITLEQLADLPLMLLDRYALLQTRLSAELARRGLTLSTIQHATNVGTVLGLVDAGLGATFLPRYMAQRYSLESRATLNVPEIDLSRNFGILVRERADLNLASTLFLDHLRAHFATTLHAGQT
ncbi:LysR family transcriptional regulator [Caballeronia sp. LZ035]|uniref:LysR family transcriptional regulator n=1 Tax=Caballeronia sp. LZ035 TaxID=3038568 RepID=UPI00285EC0CE|nr:LysR family transcriptional regulator [Caballeronia sp. LZ035]MDR5758458.1 LysR family transcriptional regulator [Caballeronia sp. LZ035]